MVQCSERLLAHLGQTEIFAAALHSQLIQQHILPAAESLATLLQQLWALPEKVAATRLEAGQVASARSCAYLRCPNLGLEGGPAAGEGAGSLKCAACRSVWYCGTACSHADWLAGHKRVCKAMATARQQEKQQRQQQQLQQ